MTLAEHQAWVKEIGLPAYRAGQIFAWVHGRGVTSTEPMSNLSKELREQLAGQVTLEPLTLAAELQSEDGTRKLALRCGDGACIETVLIPEERKFTQCLSTQVGCGLACRFCATASMGLIRNLTVAEIVDQVYRGRAGLDPDVHLSNLVFMGMGEPMNNLDNVLTAVDILCTDLGANFSPRRITISTAGVVPGIKEMSRRARNVGLAVSLNATTDEVRSQIMPVNQRWPLAALMAALRDYDLPRRRRITFEYVILPGVNDTPADAKRLPRLLQGIRSKVNLIGYNPGRVDAPYQRPDEHDLESFAERLRDKDIPTYVRRSRGDDIAAACGQLAGKI